MDKYFYLVAQLPALAYGDKPTYATADFLAEAQKWVHGRDWQVLSALADLEKLPGVSGAYRSYRAFDDELREDIARWRKARRAGQDYKPVNLPPTLLKEGNPLEIEQKLLRLRWDFLDYMESGHHFDIDFLVIYGLKLQLLERLAQFDKQRGFQDYKQRCEVN